MLVEGVTHVVGAVQEITDILDPIGRLLEILHTTGEVAINNVVADKGHKCYTNKITKVKSFRICQQCVPKADGVVDIELLAEQQHEPS